MDGRANQLVERFGGLEVEVLVLRGPGQGVACGIARARFLAVPWGGKGGWFGFGVSVIFSGQGSHSSIKHHPVRARHVRRCRETAVRHMIATVDCLLYWPTPDWVFVVSSSTRIINHYQRIATSTAHRSECRALTPVCRACTTNRRQSTERRGRPIRFSQFMLLADSHYCLKTHYLGSP